MAFGWEKKPEGEKSAGCAYPSIVIVIIGFFFIQWIFSSAMEAKTYTRLTGREVTTWEAMWVELRVQASPQQDKQAE